MDLAVALTGPVALLLVAVVVWRLVDLSGRVAVLGERQAAIVVSLNKARQDIRALQDERGDQVK